uniref:N-acetylglucosaminyl-phosphatidylinositol de-N-acetylase-like n=1 Tax=Diabrotica virgifera virgifera TaxID=50390 RepID=A0A6P7HAQ4_DIAVI
MYKITIVARFMGSLKDRSLIHKAMKKHVSQLKWFRRLYMYFSRYMIINTLQQMNLVDIELDLDLED